eukprot:3247529-Karenia_brevis.AAC.1
MADGLSSTTIITTMGHRLISIYNNIIHRVISSRSQSSPLHGFAQFAEQIITMQPCSGAECQTAPA